MVVKKILDAYDMSADKTEVVKLADINRNAKYTSVGVSFRSVTGTLDGTFKIYVSDDPVPIDDYDYTLEKTLDIDSANNNLDKLIYYIPANISNVKFIYAKNNITGGEMTVTLGTGA